ncbi:MAG: SMC family ATPase [Clostridiales Family XIII bacterium]|nr:SMC family ATPase [Clostridiales Family XIII bacterium]
MRQTNEKVEEILGINRDQFSQIVMIAQGDFRRFLLSETKDRAAILRRIFDTGRLKNFQEELKQKMLEYKRALEAGTQSFLQYANGIVCDEALESAETISAWKENPDIYRRPELMDSLETLLIFEETAISELMSELSDTRKEHEAFTTELTLIKSVNTRFDELFAKTTHRDVLLEQRQAMDDRQAKVARGVLALRNVKVFEDAFIKASANHKSAVKAAEAADTDRMGKDALFKEADGALEREKANDGEKKQLRSDIERLDGLKPKYARLGKLDTDHAAARDKIAAAETGLKKARDNETEIDGRTESLKKEADSLEGAELKIEKLVGERKDALSRVQTLDVLESNINKLRLKKEELKSLQTEFSAADAAFERVDMAFKRLEQIFLREQAGLLAAKLEAGAPCPVCGSLEHPAPAKPTAEAPSESEVDKARAKSDTARKKRDSLAGRCSLLKGETDAAETGCLAEAAEFGRLATAAETGGRPTAAQTSNSERPTDAAAQAAAESGGRLANAAAGDTGCDIETILSELPQVKSGFNVLLTGLSERIRALDKDLARRSACLSELESLDAEKKRIVNVIAQAADELNRLKIMQSSIDTERAMLRSELEFDTAEEADAALNRKKSLLKRLDAQYDKAAAARDKASSAFEQAKAVLKERLALQSEAAVQSGAALDEFNKAVCTGGFSDEADYRSALMTEKGVKDAEAEISAYHKALDIAEHDVKQLETETSGKKYIDISEHQPKLDRLNSRIEDLTKALASAQSRFDANRSAHRNIKEAISLMAGAEAQYLNYKVLSDTANGDISGKARVSFETYLQTTYFTRILRAANLRFAAMNSGRYEFKRREEPGSLRSQTGLELDVLDNYTGKARDVRTLSGGESFKASLALALGLSDIVQQTSGGVRLDAMFVDEGFGALDSESLDAAISTLEKMAGGNRAIGIISHVRELSERIDRQIFVKRGAAGSEAVVML